MAKPLWCIYYADGTTFSSNNGTPSQSPIRPVVCITDTQLQVTYGAHNIWCEFYLWHIAQSQWWPHTVQGAIYQLLNNKSDIGAVRQGRRQWDELAQAIHWRAFKDRML